MSQGKVQVFNSGSALNAPGCLLHATGEKLEQYKYLRITAAQFICHVLPPARSTKAERLDVFGNVPFWCERV